MLPRSRRFVVVTVAMALGLGAAALNAQKPGKPFTSPLKNFTVLVPDFGTIGLGTKEGTKIQKQNDKNDGTVSFMNDAGRLLRIDYNRLPTGMTVPADSADLQNFYRGALETVRQNTSSVLSERAYTLDGAPMRLAVVSFPAGSSVMDAASGKRMDSVRALLIFARGGFLYTLHAELVADIFDPPGKTPVTVDELNRRAENWLPKFYRSMTFQ